MTAGPTRNDAVTPPSGSAQSPRRSSQATPDDLPHPAEPPLLCLPCRRRSPSGAAGLTRVALLSALAALFAAPADALLTATPIESRDGVYQLSWDDPGAVVLEEAHDPQFSEARIVYRGEDKATTLTGRGDGVYFYRLRGEEDGTTAASVVQVSVSHHPLERALLFFGVGLVVFAATVGLIARAARHA